MNSNNDASNNSDNYGARVNPILTIYNTGVDPHFFREEKILSRIKRKIDGGYRLNSYDAKRILTYTARARFFDMYNFVSSYDFDRGKLKRIVSHADRLKKLSQ